MTTRGAFLSMRYGAYYHRDLPKEDKELTHVGPGTPCGEYFRRFWLPVYRSEDLQDLPRRIRILGEDLVVFRDRSGKVGLLELHCSHRGTSLEFGLVSDRGIRCCYHGWLFDVDGKILETPGEPADSTLKDRLCHGAYPTLEYKGLVFAYMGPSDRKPAFPVLDTFEMPGHTGVAGYVYTWPCNWLQIKENSMDPAHLLYLHTIVSGAQVADDLAEDFSAMPEWDYIETPIGMSYIDSRRVGDKVWVRVADFVPPHFHQFAPSGQLRHEEVLGRPDLASWSVPIDDYNTVTFRIWHLKEGQSKPAEPIFGQGEDRPYEERQRQPGDYDAQISQRPIAIHGLEHLATTDRGVIMLRNIVHLGIRAVQRGEDPKGVHRTDPGILPTYAGDAVVEVSPAPTPEEDRLLLREAGRRVAQGHIKSAAVVSLGRT